MILFNRKIAVLSLLISLLIITSCEQEDSIVEPGLEGTISSISVSDLPSSSLEFIETNFPNEEIVEAFSITSEESVNYEAGLSNETSLVFDISGEIVDFGAESDCVSCRGPRKSKRGDDNRTREEITFEELPEIAQTYITDNYEDSLFVKALIVSTLDEEDSAVTEVSYRAIISTVGMLVFDSEGNFEEVKSRMCNSEEIAIEDLSEAITTYITDNYPDAVISKARIRTDDETTYTMVVLEDIGVLVFDEDDAFVELK